VLLTTLLGLAPVDFALAYYVMRKLGQHWARPRRPRPPAAKARGRGRAQELLQVVSHDLRFRR